MVTDKEYVTQQLTKASNKLENSKSIWEIDEETIEEAAEESEESEHSYSEELMKQFLKAGLKAGRENRTAEVIIDAQFCIEQSAKAIFKIMNKNPPQRHKISLNNDRAKGVIKELPSDYDREDDVKRVIFLTSVWEPYYEAAKYGYPEINVTSHSFMSSGDAEKAISDAEFSLEVAKNLKNHVYESE